MIHRETFPAIVTNIADPEQRGRVKVKSQSLAEEGVELPDWLDPSFPYAGTGDSGWFFVPPVGTQIEVEMITGASDDDHPGMAAIAHPDWRWRCALYGSKDQVPEVFRGEEYGTRMGMRTPAGQTFLFRDKTKEIVLSGFDALRLGSEAAGEPFVLGEVLLAMLGDVLDKLALHVHTCAAPGNPSSPPVNAAEFQAIKAAQIDGRAIVSDKVYGEK